MKVFTDTIDVIEYQTFGPDQDRPFIEVPDDTDLSNKKISDGKLVDKTEEDLTYETSVENFRKVYNDRRAKYPSIPDQLDMIYHNLNSWRATIKKVKDDNPLPDDLPPDLDTSKIG